VVGTYDLNQLSDTALRTTAERILIDHGC